MEANVAVYSTLGLHFGIRTSFKHMVDAQVPLLSTESWLLGYHCLVEYQMLQNGMSLECFGFQDNIIDSDTNGY